MRRLPGTGSIGQANDGSWWAAIYLSGGRKVRRRRWSREDAELALEQILEEYADQVGVIYWKRRQGLLGQVVRHPAAPKPVPRSGVSVQVRFAILERDGFRCAYCGATPETARMVVDHIIPVAAGGSDAIENLTTACEACNAGKAAKCLTVLPDRLAS